MNMLSRALLSIVLILCAVVPSTATAANSRKTLPAEICQLEVDRAANEKWDGRTVLARYRGLRSLMQDRHPDVFGQQFWMLILLADHLTRGQTARQLTDQLQKIGFAVEYGNIESAISRMAHRGRYAKVKYGEGEPLFAATAEGLWQVTNTFSFYAKLRRYANETRDSNGDILLEDLGTDSRPMHFPPLRHTSAAVMAGLSMRVAYWLTDYAYELLGQNFGTPASATDVYATTKEMKEEKLVYRELTPTNGRQARRDGIAVEDLTQIWLEKEGEKQLIETFLFYDQAYAYLRAHPDLMMTRLLLSAVRREE